MKVVGQTTSLTQLYRLTAVFGAAGTIWLFVSGGWRAALAFLLGACISLGNLWLFDRLARGLEPGPNSRKAWHASTFAGRYIIFLAAGYVIVNALGVSPLPVVLGLFASTAAVLLSSILELACSLTGRHGA